MATTIDPLLFSGSYRSEAVARPRPSVRTFQRRRRTLGAIIIFGLASGLVTSGAFASDPAPALCYFHLSSVDVFSDKSPHFHH